MNYCRTAFLRVKETSLQNRRNSPTNKVRGGKSGGGEGEKRINDKKKEVKLT